MMHIDLDRLLHISIHYLQQKQQWTNKIADQFNQIKSFLNCSPCFMLLFSFCSSFLARQHEINWLDWGQKHIQSAVCSTKYSIKYHVNFEIENKWRIFHWFTKKQFAHLIATLFRYRKTIYDCIWGAGFFPLKFIEAYRILNICAKYFDNVIIT